MKLWRELNLDNLPLPRVQCEVFPHGEDQPAELMLGVELSDALSDPVAALHLYLRWARPRPWECSLELPRGTGRNRWRWRRPR